METTTEEEVGEELDVNSDLVTNLVKYPNLMNDIWLGKNYTGYFYANDSINVNTMSNKVKIVMAIHALGDYNYIYDTYTVDTSAVDTTVSIPEEDIKESYYKIFGSSVEFKTESLDGNDCGLTAFTYDSGSKVYKESVNGCGGTALPYYETKIIKAVKYSDRIEITEKVVYVELEWDESSSETYQFVYTNKDKTNKLATVSSNEEISIDDYLDRLDSYKYTFKKDGDNYYFYSSEKVK